MKKSSTHLRLVCVYKFVCVCAFCLRHLPPLTWVVKLLSRCVQKSHLSSILLCNYTQNNKY